jgi:signal transduction histidine kinase
MKRITRKQLLLTLIVFLLSVHHILGQIRLDTLFITGANNNPLALYYQYLEDSTGNLTSYDAAKLLQKGKFKKWSAKTFNKGFTQSAFWFAICVSNKSFENQKILWSFYTNSIQATLYKISGDSKIYSVRSASIHQNLFDRPYPVRSLSFPISLIENETQTLLVRLRSTSSDNLYLPMDITTAEDFLQYEIGFTKLIYLFFGFFIFALILNLLLFFTLRNYLHLWHSIYIFFILIFNLSEFNVDVFEIPSDLYPSFSFITKNTWALFALFFAFNVFNRFTGVLHSKTNNIIDRYVKILVLASASSNLAFGIIGDDTAFHKTSIYISSFIFGLGLLWFIYNIICGIIQRNKFTYLYLLSVSFLIIGVISFSLNALHITSFFLVPPGNITVGLAIEILILTILFVYQYSLERKQKMQTLKINFKLKQGLASAVIYGHENERRLLARDIHDDLGGTVSSLRFMTLNYFNKKKNSNVDECNYRENLMELLNKISSDIRTISHNLMPNDFETLGLKKILESHIKKINTNSPIQFQLFFEEEPLSLVKEFQISIYRIINELINNTIKHSEASEVSIQCIEYASNFEVQITDNGKGFDTLHRNLGIGLKDVRSRVELLNGKLAIDSNKNGTTIIFSIPTNNEKENFDINS